MATPYEPGTPGAPGRFHDAVYMNHRSTFWSFPLNKEQPDGQQQGPLTDNIMPDLDDSSDDTDDESL